MLNNQWFIKSLLISNVANLMIKKETQSNREENLYWIILWKMQSDCKSKLKIKLMPSSLTSGSCNWIKHSSVCSQQFCAVLLYDRTGKCILLGGRFILAECVGILSSSEALEESYFRCLQVYKHRFTEKWLLPEKYLLTPLFKHLNVMSYGTGH